MENKNSGYIIVNKKLGIVICRSKSRYYRRYLTLEDTKGFEIVTYQNKSTAQKKADEHNEVARNRMIPDKRHLLEELQGLFEVVDKSAVEWLAEK